MREPDWALAESLYREKASLDVIVREAHLPSLAALKKRIQRQGWRMTRNHAREVLEREGIQQKSETLRDVVLTECLRDAEIVQQNPPKNMGQSFRRQELIGKITTNGEKAGAWSGNGPQTTLIAIADLYHPAQWVDPRQPHAEPMEYVLHDPNGSPRSVSRQEFMARHQPVCIDVPPEQPQPEPALADDHTHMTER